MKSLEHISAVYFVGIGGIGMSALAQFFINENKQVFGYDKTPSAITDGLIAEGVAIVFEDDVNHLPAAFKIFDANNLVIYTPAIPKGAFIKNHLAQMGYMLHKRAEVLGLISKSYFTIAVAGTHGKTTTSSLIAHIFMEQGISVLAILGGIATNYNSNFLHLNSKRFLRTKPVLITEADEFDRSFLYLNPDIAVITSTDADHLDIYNTAEELQASFQQFASQVKQVLIVNEKVSLHHPKKIVYGPNSPDNYYDIGIENGVQTFSATIEHKKVEQITAGMPGTHNIENALAAIIACHEAGLPLTRITPYIATFKGVKRRFEKVFENQTHTVIDDYAHHPAELNALIGALKTLYPNREITMLFQPHLFSRTQDFMDDFATSLSEVSQLVLLPIYPARELPIAGVDSAVLLAKIGLNQKSLQSKEEVLSFVEKTTPKLLVIAGAGDIDRLVNPIYTIYNHKYGK